MQTLLLAVAGFRAVCIFRSTPENGMDNMRKAPFLLCTRGDTASVAPRRLHGDTTVLFVLGSKRNSRRTESDRLTTSLLLRRIVTPGLRFGVWGPTTDVRLDGVFFRIDLSCRDFVWWQAPVISGTVFVALLLLASSSSVVSIPRKISLSPGEQVACSALAACSRSTLPDCRCHNCSSSQP